jgi:hypothetical protein
MAARALVLLSQCCFHSLQEFSHLLSHYASPLTVFRLRLIFCPVKLRIKERTLVVKVNFMGKCLAPSPFLIPSPLYVMASPSIRFSESFLGRTLCTPWLPDSVKGKREGGAIAPPVCFFRSPKATSVIIIRSYLASACRSGRAVFSRIEL